MTVEGRLIELETALAEERGVSVHRLVLRPERPVPIWDFGHTEALIARGYEVARADIAAWQAPGAQGWHAWVARLSLRERRSIV